MHVRDRVTALHRPTMQKFKTAPLAIRSIMVTSRPAAVPTARELVLGSIFVD